AELEVDRVTSVETYVVVTFGEGPEEMSANLQGPLLINTENNLAKQLVLVNSSYGVRHSVMQAVEALEKRTAPEREPVLVP
ncbi:MAG: flagellar assembly protein FliW, partial [Candidatus Zixiibacteriota bacterium]